MYKQFLSTILRRIFLRRLLIVICIFTSYIVIFNNYSLKSRWIVAKYLPSRESGEVNIPKATDYSPRLKRITVLVYTHEGCVRLGNPDLDFQNLNPDFPIEREIRKRISPPRNPSSGWISIKKSKSGFHGFPFYRSIGKSENGFAKLFSWTAVLFFLIMRARARPLFLTTVFQILLRISPSNGKNENPKTDILGLKSVFGFRVRLQIRNPDFKI